MRKTIVKTTAVTVLVMLLLELCLVAAFYPALFESDGGFTEKLSQIDRILEKRCIYDLDKDAAVEYILKTYLGSL